MRDQSQIDAMRAAIRGDLERSQARFQPAAPAEPAAEPEPEPAVEEAPRTGLFASFFKRL